MHDNSAEETTNLGVGGSNPPRCAIYPKQLACKSLELLRFFPRYLATL